MEAIGGYFELALPTYPSLEYLGIPNCFGFQSARSALDSLLLQTGFSRAWIPYFICGSIARELLKVGIKVANYELEPDYRLDKHYPSSSDEALLLVNYFGVCEQ